MQSQSLYSLGSKAVQHCHSAHACHGYTLRPISIRRPSIRQSRRSDIRHSCQARLGQDERHVVSAPRSVVGEKDHLASVLLMLLPGAYMQCQAYSGLINKLKVQAILHAVTKRSWYIWSQVSTSGIALQDDLEGRVQLWVAVAYPMWQEVDAKAPDVMEQATARVTACVKVLLEQSRGAGFPADLLPSGRAPNSLCNKHWHLVYSSGMAYSSELTS